jgi:formylglycine-generating enzyme required for sulfatase activity
MEFMRIRGTAAGSFWMGSPNAEPERNPWEQRFDAEEQIAVTIPADFHIGRAEVTQAQWVAIMGGAANRSRFRGDDLPVENVSWEDTQLFLQKLNEKLRDSGQRFRLPTEAEWEYACRGGATGKDDSKPFHFDDGPSSQITSDRANCDAKSAPYNGSLRGEFRDRTTPAGSFKPNRFGLCDMHGNVWEWCQDYYGPLPGGRNPLRDVPYRGDERRVLRGGSWHVDGADCRAAVRYGAAPTDRADFTGFRVVLELP